MAADPPGYPRDLTEVAFLRDGTEVLFRAVRPDDYDRFVRLYHRLSPETLYYRFFAPVPRLRPQMLRRLVEVDYTDRLAMVAVIDDEVVGVARFDRLAAVAPDVADVPDDEAEMALLVDDGWQGHGIGTRLLWRLTAAARERGIRVFSAGVLAENHRMMGLLRVIADELEVVLDRGEYLVRFKLDAVHERP